MVEKFVGVSWRVLKHNSRISYLAFIEGTSQVAVHSGHIYAVGFHELSRNCMSRIHGTRIRGGYRCKVLGYKVFRPR